MFPLPNASDSITGGLLVKKSMEKCPRTLKTIKYEPSYALGGAARAPASFRGKYNFAIIILGSQARPAAGDIQSILQVEVCAFTQERGGPQSSWDCKPLTLPALEDSFFLFQLNFSFVFLFQKRMCSCLRRPV